MPWTPPTTSIGTNTIAATKTRTGASTALFDRHWRLGGHRRGASRAAELQRLARVSERVDQREPHLPGEPARHAQHRDAVERRRAVIVFPQHQRGDDGLG